MEIDKYMTVSEASERWGIPENTVTDISLFPFFIDNFIVLDMRL